MHFISGIRIRDDRVSSLLCISYLLAASEDTMLVEDRCKWQQLCNSCYAFMLLKSGSDNVSDADELQGQISMQ